MKPAFWRVSAVAACWLAWSASAPANEPPTIRHQAIRAAVRGQPISVMARVTDEAGPVKYVTLFYSLSRDAAPFRVPMKASDADLYVGTIPPDLIVDIDQILYYIEAMDSDEATSETAWNTIQIKSPSARPVVEEKPVVAPAAPTPPPREKSSLLGVGLIAGGAVAVAGAAVLLANTDDSSGGGGGDDDDEDYAGVYPGSVTECLALSGQPQTCDTWSMSIAIDSSGSVQSSDLRPSTLLTGQMSGNKFLLVADLAGGTNGVTGEIYYDGTVVDGELFGRITGTYTGGTNGEAGVYSGSFDGTRQ
ncbi:MAG TPA: hypothetical protein P5567_02415 [Kiritimatiellia bacterium]|nr:hypothetical protein [Kiritimatiellia bacterium]HSA19741.1 hypothetical protein [Kiritimatiellia bacterium]